MSERHCVQCGLSELHPAARIDASDTCALCRRAPVKEQRALQLERARKKFESVVELAKVGSAPHVTVAASGGKDSSYTMLRLRKHYGLEVIAVAVDNGFLSEAAEENLNAITRALDIQLIIARPPADSMRALFSTAAREEPFSNAALQRASGVCNACIGMVKSIVLNHAMRERTPLMAWGWSPGQAPLASAVHRPTKDLLASFETIRTGALAEAMDAEALAMFPTPEQLEAEGAIPTFINPLAIESYDEDQMRDELIALGWRVPTDTDPNSTNCRLNALGNHLHRARHGVNPYALELASLVREGWMEYGEALDRLSSLEDPEIVAEIARELGVEDLILQGEVE